MLLLARKWLNVNFSYQMCYLTVNCVKQPATWNTSSIPTFKIPKVVAM